MSKYLVFDRETENHEYRKRFASPFYEKNWTVALGWKKQGDKQCSSLYFPTKEDEKPLQIDDDVTILVGHNLKFDLLYGWKDPQLIEFFKRGGRIWCTQYAEYLLEGMHPDSHMVAMDQIAEKYGGRKKVDAVKALWDAGMLTSQIDKDMLLDYLIGTEEEKRNSGDIGNTELIFLGQIKKAVQLGMLTMIQARMDGLLATTEMEFNGLKIDVAEAARRMKLMEAELAVVEKELTTYIPELPVGLEFNWNSNIHKSCLIFGGTVKYKKSARYIDENTGKYARKKASEQWPLFNGIAVDPAKVTLNEKTGLYSIEPNKVLPNGKTQDVFTSGKKKGSGRTKKVDVPGEFKTKIQDFLFEFKGYTTPNPEWQGALVDGAGTPVYQTNDDVITELGSRDIPFLKLMAKRSALVKDLGTYYVRYDPKTKDYKGMLTAVLPGTHIVNHSLNHVNTVTSRLSSSNPNLQNIPRGDTSEVKKMFISRFEGGKMLEVDYSQLEVVVQGVLSGDENLCADLRNKIDFHCKRVSAKFGISYEEALFFCKDASAPEHKLWKTRRTGVKEFSFQRAYGAGAPAIAASTGMSIDDVKDLIEAEDIMYPGVSIFNDNVEKAVKRSSVPFKDFSRDGRTFRRGYWQAPTGTMYSFRSYDPQKWQKEKGITDSFMPTEMKNYPIQGTGGEIVQIILGKLFRRFVETDNYGGLALMCNTVHDCVWFDYVPEVQDELCRDVKEIMESVPEVLNELYGMDVPVPFPVELEIGDNLYDKQVIHI
jgi:DNA polymerase I-like protein with 3'-5' exonuclease and polymerase domains